MLVWETPHRLAVSEIPACFWKPCYGHFDHVYTSEYIVVLPSDWLIGYRHLWALKQVYLMNWQIVFYMEPLLYTSPNISKMLVCESLFLIVVVRALSLSLPAGWRVESFSPAFQLYTRSFWTSWRKLQPQWKGKAALLNRHTHTCRGFLHILGPIMGSLWLAFQLYKTAFFVCLSWLSSGAFHWQAFWWKKQG